MKRSRDNDDDDGRVLVDSELKRPVISPRVEQPGQGVQMSKAISASNLTTNDALTYLKWVKQVYKGDKDNKYATFLNIMKDFKAQSIDTDGVIVRVKELFEDNRHLLLGFNAFLPKGFEITLEPEDPERSPVTFEDAIGFVNKIKARFDDDVYRAFIDILNKFRKNNKCTSEVFQQVSVLFRNHEDLLVDFIHFLPGISGTVSAYYAPNLSNHISNGDGRVSPMAIEWYNHVQKNLHDVEQWNHQEKDEVKKEDGDDNIVDRKRKARRDDSANDQFRREIKNIEMSFRGKVKHRLQDPEVAEKCSHCIRAFMYSFFTADDFRNLIYSLLGAHSDVVEACEDFLSYVEKNGSLRNNKQAFRNLKLDEIDDHDSQDTEKNKDYNTRERYRHDRGLSSNAKDVQRQKEKFLANPIQELDLSNCERCTPSYRLLPENYPIPSTKGRTEIGNEVLNDRWVSVTSGSEDYSFKHMRKNQYEESLFRCEDDRYELDMLLESVKATAKSVEELIDSMNARGIKTESSFCIEDHLSALNLRCIERLYGDHGLDVMDVLRKNAPVALPVILTRLKQKQGEWESCRVDFSKVWAEIYAKNYPKSLDHRSFYFKQQDTKNLTTKGMLEYIKELFKKGQTDDELLLSAYTRHSPPVKPHIEVNYLDPDVHEDIFQIIKYSCAEICTPEQTLQVLKTWSTFIEPMFGIPSHDILCNAPQSTAGEKIIDDAAILKGNDQGCRMEVMPKQESQASIESEETESRAKAEREEGELSPTRNLEKNNFSAFESEDAYANGNVSGSESANEKGEDDKKAESEGEAPFPDSLLKTVKPLNVNVPMGLQEIERNSRIFYGNDSFYLLFRLHQLLYERILSAKLTSENRWGIPNGANQTDVYARFKNLLYSLLNGSIGNAKYEDECRAILGSQSFSLFTLDKLIHRLVMQLQTIVTGSLETNFIELSDYERSRSSKTFTDAGYRANAQLLLLDEENLYRIEFFTSPSRMTIQLMERDDKHDDGYDPTPISTDPYFAAYLNNEPHFVCHGRKKATAVFLKRNTKMYSTGDGGVADFCKAMEGVMMHNGLGLRILRVSKKFGYVVGTEDSFFRPKKMRLRRSVSSSVRLHRAKKRKLMFEGEDPEVD